MTILFLIARDARSEVASLQPYLRMSLGRGLRMDASRMKPRERKTCPWVGFGILKGVTNIESNTSIIGFPVYSSPDDQSGFHSKLIRGLSHVDPCPQCYDPNKARYGFGGYIRWAYFADPDRGHGYLGIDFSLAASPLIGVATSVEMVHRCMTVLMQHGIPGRTTGVLLEWNMCEHPNAMSMRRRTGLQSVRDWKIHAARLLRQCRICWRCGLPRDRTYVFCPYCGGSFQQHPMTRKGGRHAV